MKSPITLFAVAMVWLAACLSALSAAPSEKKPGEKATGKVYEWTSEGGVRFQYYIPRRYDPEKGAPMTVILHGSNLDRRWGFANHKAGEFRPDDIVISPDGTTANGRGGFNSLGRAEDAAKFTALLDDLRGALNITAVYLYGHSQGSFFALYYAGEAPDAVAGVVAHASGVWTQTKLSDKGHGQAIVLMHGTADPVVPYSQSAGGVGVYRGKGYPTVRLRTLEGWNHWPAEIHGPIPHVSQQLAWVEGMTSTDTTRLAAAYATLAKPKEKTQHDFAALYQVAKRLSELRDWPERGRASAAQTAKKVDALAKQHIAAMRLDRTKADAAPDGAPWIGHLPMFLRAYGGVPAADQLAEDWQAILDAHRDAARTHFTAYRKANKAGDQKAAFGAGVSALREAYLARQTSDPSFLKTMAKWAGDRGLGIAKEELKAYKKLFSELEDSLKKGRAAFESTNRRGGI